MDYEVSVAEVEPRPTAVIAARTSWAQYPSLWPELSGEVWACLRAAGVHGGCRNVMVYLDDTPSVEVGVELPVPCALTGRIVASHLPGGRAATTTHRGLYSALGEAHDAVLAWCAANGERTTGVRWEVYGPNEPVPWVQVSWALIE
jgi:effector-binding domain-containing protein